MKEVIGVIPVGVEVEVCAPMWLTRRMEKRVVSVRLPLHWRASEDVCYAPLTAIYARSPQPRAPSEPPREAEPLFNLLGSTGTGLLQNGYGRGRGHPCCGESICRNARLVLSTLSRALLLRALVFSHRIGENGDARGRMRPANGR